MSRLLALTAVLWSAAAAAAPCDAYCDAQEGAFLDACAAADHAAEDCVEAWLPARDTCVERQCSLDPVVPADLTALADALIPGLLGAEYAIVDAVPHFYATDDEAPGSMVFRLESTGDGSRAFLELGNSLEQPPIICYGTGLSAEEALTERAVERLTGVFGEADYALTKRFLSAAHPILQFTDGHRDLFYAVHSHDVSDAFTLVDDPEADADALAQRRESHKRLWQDQLDAL